MSDVITLNHIPLAVLIVRKVYDMYRRGEFFSHLFMGHCWHFLQQQDAIDCTKKIDSHRLCSCSNGYVHQLFICAHESDRRGMYM